MNESDDPTEQHEVDATVDARTGDPTQPDGADELGPTAVLTVVMRPDDVDLSVMEREFCAAVDGARTLELIAEVVAISPRGAGRLARGLVQRNVLAVRGHVGRRLNLVHPRE